MPRADEPYFARDRPPKAVENTILVPGGAFVHKVDDASGTRLCIIVNKKPTKTDTLLFVAPTKQVEKRRTFHAKRNTLHLLVDVTPKDYSELTRPSVIDCGFKGVHQISKADLRRRILARRVKACRQLPGPVLERVLLAYSFALSGCIGR